MSVWSGGSLQGDKSQAISTHSLKEVVFCWESDTQPRRGIDHVLRSGEAGMRHEAGLYALRMSSAQSFPDGFGAIAVARKSKLEKGCGVRKVLTKDEVLEVDGPLLKPAPRQ